MDINTTCGGRWVSTGRGALEPPLTSANLRALFDHEHPALRVSQFATPAECADWLQRLSDHVAFSPYVGHADAEVMGKIGPVQCEYRYPDRSAYFSLARKVEAQLDGVWKGDGPVTRVVARLHDVAGSAVQRAWEPGLGHYFHGVVQRLQGAGMALHTDQAALDAPGWAIEAVRSQVSWVLHLGGAPTGVCRVYQRQWRPSDEQHWRLANSYAYNPQVVRGVSGHDIVFNTGDLVLFNSGHFHQVLAGEVPRFTVSGFVGLVPHNNQLWLWS